MKILLLVSILLTLIACEKECPPIVCEDNIFIEQYNTRTGGVARHLYPYDCTLTEQENFAQCDCYISEEISCRLKIID